ncbi:hypothetical protein [Micromonospora sp. NPDC049891]|uniref:hypothetical protein n=1 Tax=Micromonospora sp. NPDC049891 TaxID=3155655 RepID=UPI0033C6F2FB
MTPPTPPTAVVTHGGPSDRTAPSSGAERMAADGRSGARPATTHPAGSRTGPETGRRAAGDDGGLLSRDALDADLARAVRHTARMRQAFYLLVLLVALAGQVTGAVQALDVPVLVVVPAVAALELGGVVVMANADVRRRLGERAIASRLLSAAIAAGAVTFNWVAHHDHLVGGFYAGMSALGYLVWLMHAGNQRRDRLRATGDLPPTPPAYEVFAHWIRHPVITGLARAIAKADGLDLYESLKAARAVTARHRRDTAIGKVLHRKIRAAVDPSTADIAVRVYDLDEIAARLAASADYHGLTTLLAADLAPERVVAAPRAGNRRRWFRRPRSAEVSRTPEPSPPPACPHAPAAPDAGRQEPEPTHDPEANRRGDDRQRRAGSHAAAPVRAGSSSATPHLVGRTGDITDVDEADGGQGTAGDDGDGGCAEAPRTTAEAVAYWLRREPNLDPELLAERIGRSLRSVYRYLPPDYPRRPGIARQRTLRQPAAGHHAGQSE